MYANYVSLTKKPADELEKLQKKYIALKYSGGDQWKKIGLSFKPLIEYVDKVVTDEKEEAYKGQEDNTSRFPKASQCGEMTAELASTVGDAAKKYYDKHKDPKSWLASSKKAEEERAELAREIWEKAKKLATDAKRVKDGKAAPEEEEAPEEKKSAPAPAAAAAKPATDPKSAAVIQFAKTAAANIEKYAKDVLKNPTVAQYIGEATRGFHQAARAFNATLAKYPDKEVQEWGTRVFRPMTQDAFKPTSDDQVAKKVAMVVTKLQEIKPKLRG